jgi:accessory gene regulator B
MIEALSDKISAYVYRHNERQHVSQAVMKFALISIIMNSTTILLCLFIGFLDGHFKETLLATIAMAILRILAGGYHFRSPLLCIIVSTAAVTSVPFILLSLPVLYALTAVSALLILLFAPADSKKYTRLSNRALTWMKYIALLMVLSNLGFQSETLSVSWFIVSLTLLPLKGGENDE